MQTITNHVSPLMALVFICHHNRLMTIAWVTIYLQKLLFSLHSFTTCEQLQKELWIITRPGRMYAIHRPAVNEQFDLISSDFRAFFVFSWLFPQQIVVNSESQHVPHKTQWGLIIFIRRSIRVKLCSFSIKISLEKKNYWSARTLAPKV